jgi:hypothetical protein
MKREKSEEWETNDQGVGLPIAPTLPISVRKVGVLI